jgi:hypothetical protein
MEPTRKSGSLMKAINAMAKEVFGNERTSSIEDDVCVSCAGPATAFRDALSVKEYRISGLCQICQDKVFGGE